MDHWYDIIQDSNLDKEILVPMARVSPSPSDFDDTYPVVWGTSGYIYFNTKIGAVMVKSSLSNLEGKSVELSIR